MQISFDKGQTLKAELQIYDVLGKMVLEMPVSKQITEIDLEGVVKGIYLVKLYSGGNSITKRIVLQ